MPVAIFKDDYKKAAKALDYHPLIDGIAFAIAKERERCAVIAERVCREHADPKAGYAAATAIRTLANTPALRKGEA